VVAIDRGPNIQMSSRIEADVISGNFTKVSEIAGVMVKSKISEEAAPP
jgi:hypothetical protein